MQKEAKNAAKIMGVKDIEFFDFSDNEMDLTSNLIVTKEIEKLISKFKPDKVYTHSSIDINIDHRIIFNGVLTATRPHSKTSVKELITFETPSSTEWGNIKFKPNYFVDIQKFLKTKIKAFKYYKKEIEIFPHPRSEKSIINRSQYWGSTIGKKNVEPFIVIRQIFD